MLNEQFVFYILFTGILLLVSISDILWRRVPNFVIYPAILLALTHVIWNGWLGSALLGGLVGSIAFLVPVLIYGPNRSGMGDVKLALLIGMVLGFPGVVIAIGGGFILAGVVVAMGVIIGRLNRHSVIPFGPFLATGAFFAVWINLANFKVW